MKFTSVAVGSLVGLVSSVGASPGPAVETHADFNSPNMNRYIVKADALGKASNTAVNTIGRGKYAIIEFENSESATQFMTAKGFAETEMWPDSPMYPQDSKDAGEVDLTKAQETPWGIDKVFFDALSGESDIPSTLPEVTKDVCIIDSGYQLNHPDLVDSATAADPSQSSTSSSLYFGTDGCKHGTHVAGTIVASDNDEGVIGVYPGAKTKVVRTFANSCGWAYTSELLDAVDRCADSGASIITMSLGSSYRFPGLCEGIADLVDDENILVIAAAGNGAGTSDFFPASCGETTSVAATDSNDNVAYFSQHNGGVDIAGPGVGVRSTTGSSGYSNYSGTSMAAPHVAGVAMLLWNSFPSCSNKQIRTALYESATDKGAPGRDDYYGNGIVNYYAAKKYLEDNDCGNSQVAGGEPNEWFKAVFGV